MANSSAGSAGFDDGSACLDLVGLSPLMARTSGRPEILIALIDGPIALDHPDLIRENIHEVPGKLRGACIDANDAACAHGTFVAGILHARRGSRAPAISPGCSLLVRPIFPEAIRDGAIPSATAEELAEALMDVIETGARVVNLSAALQGPSPKNEHALEQALDHALRRGVLVVAAAGNDGAIGSSVITRHRWVMPVVACDRFGRPMVSSNLGASIGRNGLSGPGDRIISLSAGAEPRIMSGSSAATPFLTGTVALLLSEFPDVSAAEVKFAVTKTAGPRTSITPPVLNASAAYEAMSRARS